MTQSTRMFLEALRCAAKASLVLCLGSTHAPAAAPPQIDIVGHALHRLGPVGAQGWGETDVDGDGRVDLVTSTDGPAALILVYGRLPGSSALGLKQSMIGLPDSIAALTTSPAAHSRVISLSPDRTATRFGGWPLAPIGSFAVAHDVRLARIGDIDADGTLELVCAGDGQLSAYALPGGTLEWSMPLAVADIVFASFDADPALELVIAGGDGAPGIVLDGATRIVEWSRPEGLGTHVAAGAFGLSHEPAFLAAPDFGAVTGFTVAPYDVDWSLSNFDTDGVASGDTDADGRDEFAIGDGQWGSIRIYDAPYQQMLYEMPNLGHGLWGLGMLDFDADLREEVWYSARIENSSNFDVNFAAAIFNPITARPRLTIESYRQGATASLLADLDQDGSIDWATGTSYEHSYRGLLRIINAETLQEMWRAPTELANGFVPSQMVYRGLHASQVDADPPLELIAVGGNGSGDFRILVIDGLTHEVERQIPEPIDRWYATATNSRLVQHIPGGPPELLVASYRYAAPANVKLDAYALPSGDLLWSSETVGSTYDKSMGLDVGQLDSDPSLEYLLVHTLGLTAFDASSGQLQWTLPVATQGGLIVPTPSGNRVLSFTTVGDVTLYDPASLLPVGSFSLPGPLEAIARLPDDDDVLVAISNEHLKLIDLDGQVLSESIWIGAGPGAGESLHVVRDGSEWLVSAGRSFTTFQFRIHQDGIFEHGFE